MNFEEYRLKSFKHWPIPYVDVRELARDGFYYTGESDRVICNFCKTGLYRWDPNDIVAEEHKKQASQCPWVLNQVTDNVPMANRRPKLIVFDYL